VGQKMHIAICLWGLLRSLPYTYESFFQYVVKPLQQYNYTYDIIMHTYQLQGQYQSERNKEKGIFINASNYHLLQPQYIYIEDQDEFDANINYWLYQKQGDPWSNQFQSFKNHLRALNSLNHVTMVIESLLVQKQMHYDGIIFVRPDVKFIHPLPIELLPINDRKFYDILSKVPISNPSSSHNLLPEKRAESLKSPLQPLKEALFLPDFHRSCFGTERNDRMAMGTVLSALLYGLKFQKAYEYSLTHKLHAEKFTFHYLTRDNDLNNAIIEIPFRFQRIRVNGDIHIRDYEAITPEAQLKLQKKGIEFVGKGRRTPTYLKAFYSLLETLTFHQRYIWNHDDHGNLFCHPHVYLKYREFQNYQNEFQRNYLQYQKHLLQQPLQSPSSQLDSFQSNSSKQGEPVDTHYIHHLQKYSNYFRDASRSIHCSYEMRKKTGKLMDHKDRPTFRPNSTTGGNSSGELSPPRSLTTSYLVPVNCTTNHKFHHTGTVSHSSNPTQPILTTSESGKIAEQSTTEKNESENRLVPQQVNENNNNYKLRKRKRPDWSE
jgi:hypothetical protein